MFVLGIDPGVARCGYCVVEQRGRRTAAHALGVLTTPANTPLPLRLRQLQEDLAGLFDTYRPAVLAVERVLLHVSARTALTVGQASGLALAEAGRRGVEVAEYSPNVVKGAIVGYGSASKAQVHFMVQTILSLAVPPKPADAADAAAIALCHLAHADHRATTVAR